VNEQQGDGIGSFRPMVDEVKRHIVGVVRVRRLDSSGELLQLRVDGGLFGEPIVVVEPVVTERGEIGECWSLGVGWFVSSWRNR